MIKTLIVEDELLARTGLRMLIDWDAYGFELLPDAVDGEEAFRRIQEEHPDLILLDLDIPKISGLELLKLLNEKHITCKVIICSCDMTFNSAVTALDYGVVYYLMKYGLTKEELLKSLKRAVGNIGIPSGEGEKKVSALSRQIPSLKKFTEVFSNGTVMCLCIQWKNMEDLVNLNIAVDICLQFFHREEMACSVYIYEHIPVVLVEGKFLDASVVSSLAQEVDMMLDTKCYIGYAACHNKSNEWLARFANVCASAFFHGKDNKVIRFAIDYLPELSVTSPADYSFLFIDLENAIKKLNEDKIRKSLGLIFDSLEKHTQDSVSSVRQVLVEILGLFAQHAREIGRNIEEIRVDGHTNHYQTLSVLGDLSEAIHWFDAFVHLYVKTFFLDQKKSESSLMRNVLNYITEHVRERFSLSEVADYAGVSAQYLSSFFKQTMNESFVHYVTRQKMQIAREELEKGRSTAEVADELGFSDVSYFSRISKKYLDTTVPKEKR